MSTKVDLDLLLHEPKSKGFLLPSQTTYILKFESDQAKLVVCHAYKLFTQTAKVDICLWPFNKKWIGFILSKSTTSMWSWKLIGQKLQSVLCIFGFIQRVPSLTWTLNPGPKINRVPTLIIYNLHEVRKWLDKTAVCTKPMMFYTVSNVTLAFDPKT